MEKQAIEKLIVKYNAGQVSPAEIEKLEQLIEEGNVSLEELTALKQVEDSVISYDINIQPSISLDDQFYKMLKAEKKKQKKFSFSLPVFDWNMLLPRLAFAATFVACGFLGGYWIKSPGEKTEVKQLSQEVGELKEMMMLSLLEKESASERLRAVSLTTEMDGASKKVTSALIQTLNQDPNVNVRLAALDALRPYVRDNTVRAELVRSIPQQDSPLVQVALAEFMHDILERKSVQEFNKILKGDKTPQDIKNRIKEKIQILI